LQLSQSGGIQKIPQLALPSEQELDQLASSAFEVGEHAQRFQGLLGEVVRLVHDNGAIAPRFVDAQEMAVQFMQEDGQGGVGRHIEPEVCDNGFQEIQAVNGGVEDPGGVQFLLLVQGPQKLEQERGFAHSDLSQKEEKSLSAYYAEVELSNYALRLRGGKVALLRGGGSEGVGIKPQISGDNLVVHVFPVRLVRFTCCKIAVSTRYVNSRVAAG
jgi:hypothetical protein